MNRLLFLFCLIYSFSCFAHHQEKTVRLLDVTGKNKSLDGEWDFYWQTLFSEYQLNKDSLVADKLIVPGEWPVSRYAKQGYGLYVLHVVLKNPHTQIALKIPTESGACNVFVNGKLLAKTGQFGTSAEKCLEDYNPQLITFDPVGDTIEIAIELSCFHYRVGGLVTSLVVGEVDPMVLSYHRYLFAESFIVGALLLIFFFFICYYLIQKTDKTALYFSLLCIIAALRVASTEEILIRQIGITMSWTWLVKIELISIFLIPVAGAKFLFSLLNERRYQGLLWFFIVITSVLCVFVLFTNTYLGSFIVPYFHYLALAELLFLLFIVLKSMILKEHELARWAAAGYLFVFLFGINDILYAKGIINTFFATPFAIFAYVFVQSIVLAKNYSKSFIAVEELSSELRQVNKNQESIINHRTAELEGYNKVKDKIFSIISHDLRAPISTLSSVLSLAEDADDKTIAELRGYFKGIKRNVDNLNLTLDNMLVWSQSQINGIQPHPEILSVKEDVERVISLYSLIALQKEITLMHTLQGTYKVKMDPAHLNLILRNIISNSLKFTHMGGSIIISASRPSADMVKICIEDNGIGIHPDKIASLFNPQQHFTTYGTQNEKGTGLGLMLCKEYAEQNGGSITVESTIGQGAKVCLRLPAAH